MSKKPPSKARRFSMSRLLGKGKEEEQQAAEPAARRRFSLAPERTEELEKETLPKSNTTVDLRALTSSAPPGASILPSASPKRPQQSPRDTNRSLMSAATPKSNPRYRRHLNAHFKLPAEHQLIDHFLCAMQYVNMNPGRLFVTSEELCFFSRVQGYVIKKKILYTSISSLEKKNSALVVPDAIQVCTMQNENFLFTGLANQAEAMAVIEAAYRKATSNSARRSRSRSRVTGEESGFRQDLKSLNVADAQGNFLQKAVARVTKVDSVKNLSQMLSNEEEEEEEEEAGEELLDSPISRELQEHFNVPRDERVFETCDCALRQGSYQRGRLYISNRFICFRSLSGKSSIVQLAFELVEAIEEVTLANVYPIGIRVTTKADPPVVYTFGFFLDRKRVFDALQKAQSSFKEVDRTLARLKGDPKALFQDVFVDGSIVAPSEGVVSVHRCVMADPVPRKGYLFLTPNFLCFYVLAYHVVCKEAIPFASIIYVKAGKPETPGAASSSIIVYTFTRRYVFSYLTDGAATLSSVQESWKVLATVHGLPEHPPPKPDFQYVRVGGYIFCLPKGAKKTSEQTDDGYRATFSSSRNEKQLRVTVRPPWPAVCSLDDNELDFLRYEAERYLLLALGADEAVTILSSKQFVRQMQADSDSCSWLCWQVRARSTQKSSLVVMYCRRKYLPPTADVHQDIIFVFTGQNLKKRGRAPRMRRVEQFVDTLVPKVVYKLDVAAVQFRLDSLLLDRSALEWARAVLLRQPDTRDLAVIFFKSFFHQLEKADIMCICTQLAHARMLFPTVQPTSPIDAISTLDTLLERPCEDESEWSARVSGYLGYAVEHFDKAFGWQTIVELLEDDSCPRSVEDTVHQTMRHLVHMRRGKAGGAPYLPVSLDTMLSDENVLKDFSINERVALKLLESGQFRGIREAEGAAEGIYPRFLVALLRNFDTEDLAIGACKEMAKLAVEEGGSKALLVQHHALPALKMLLLELTAAQSSNGLLVHAAAKALVNISSSFERAKNLLVQEGMLPFIIRQFLKNRMCGESVLRMMLKLLRNCTDNSERRAIVTMEGGVSAIVSLLRQRRDTEAPIMVDIVTAIWNVTDDGNRGLVTVEGVIPLLSHVLKASKLELLLEKTLGALLAVGAGHGQNKLKIVRQGILPKLCVLLSTTNNPRILRNSLALLTSLCSEAENQKALAKEKMTSVIICLANFGDPDVQPLAEALLECM